ncbi:peptidylprolyl isomerase [Ramlibacter humi]|uniref:Chaperone SurA n=1 Tax=Ramlibacter humi TaxID=2530451 RepID=A0A4Z0BRK2_9BURK|nr:peptidylprolyl isomerase [Ramlibacter humi]TFZ01943.1 molecular chaperone SurA [Ramlibacter humi]
MSPRALALLLAGLAAAADPALAQLRPTAPLTTAPVPSSRPTGPRQADYIVAVVNSEPITNNEVRTRLLRFEQQLAQQGAAMPPRGELARVVLERLISEKAQLQLARENGLKASDAQVDQAEQNFARQNDMDVATLRRRLAATGVDSAAFREDLRNQILLSRLREREVDQRVKVTDLDVEQFMREQASQSGPTELNLGHILVAVPENASEAQVRAAQEKAQRVAEKARAGEDFGKLARENSDAPGAANGGQMGMRGEDRYPGLFLDAVRSLPVGGVSQVVRSGAGFHVLKVVEKRQGGLATAVTQTHSRHILLRLSGSLTEAAAVARLADFKKRIQSGQATFEQLAREFSQDASAQRGGDLGWVNPGTFVPEFEDVLDTLEPGQISDPLVSRFGVHLVQLLGHRTAELSPREQRDVARNVLREKKLDEAYAQWAQEVRGRAYVDFREPPQ